MLQGGGRLLLLDWRYSRQKLVTEASEVRLEQCSLQSLHQHHNVSE